MDLIHFSWKTRKGSLILISQSFISRFVQQYSKMKWTQEHFTGQLCCLFVGSGHVDIEPFSGVDWDDITKISGVYRITSEGHQGWSQHVSKELGNYDYLFGADVCILSNSFVLPNIRLYQIDHRHPMVREDLFSWIPWILDVSHSFDLSTLS